MKRKNMTTSQLRNSINRSPWRRGVFLLPLALACFGLLPPKAFGVTPAPDGGYPGWNTAEGQDALFNLTTGGFNTAIGAHALYEDTTGQGNTAVGAWPLAVNVSGNRNVAVGQGALGNNTGSGNVAVGFGTLIKNRSSGNSSQALGFVALFNQRDGIYNNGFGRNALYSNVTGDNNTAMGDGAGFNITGNGNVDIGAGIGGVVGENNTTRIRNIYSSLASGRAVYVNSDNKIGALPSSRRYKEEIKPMDKASEPLFALNPVTFRYKKEVDPARALSFGLIAEDVAEINPELVTRDENGNPQTVRYESINTMLLNELLKENRKLQEMEGIAAQRKKDFEATIAQREKQIKSLTASLREQVREIQEVSAQLAAASPFYGGLEASKPVAQVVSNP
jgi:hypothetical protein